MAWRVLHNAGTRGPFLLAVIRLEDVFQKTIAEPPLFYMVVPEAQVALNRAAQEAKGGPVLIEEYKLIPAQSRGPWRGPSRGAMSNRGRKY